VTALFLGFFTAAWFGWAQASPPEGLRVWLSIGSAVGWLIAVAGAIVGFRAPRRTSALYDRAAGRRYGILVGVEFAVAGIGAAILGIMGLAEYISAWVCAVVGVHFFPLAPLLRDRSLHILGAALCAIAVAGTIAGVVSGVAVSTVVGFGAGIALLAFAAASLIRALRLDRDIV
jgi:hypothetical protein